MKTFFEIKPGLLKRSSLALGFFDGVHPGHQAVIKKAVDEAIRQNATPALITFKEHPRALTLGKSPPLLSMPEQRLEVAEELGIEAALLLSFTEDLCRLSPEDYVQQVLVDCMGACSLSVGFNHRFGRNRVGTPEILAELGKSMGFGVHVASEIMLDGLPISSSRIREALAQGDVELCKRLLGRAYSITGIVERGDGRGKSIGFPTANTGTPEELILPALGVYSGYAKLENGKTYPCVINVGLRPTFGQHTVPRTEVHIFDFNADIYGQRLSVKFMHFIRPEQRFSGVDELKNQILKDCEFARKQLALESHGAAPHQAL
ncbi:MAG: bifunctional riboflavin kinase/FAD synthetase [Candidatus Obscuribacterales bacterium]|nr:bifunctional riboflavin kinase/FAD synthetase [Candidatus Obscuribacterales bacterium]